jgi:C1A family cysteine protease
MAKPTPTLGKGMGWLPSPPDQRDLVMAPPPLLAPLRLPRSVDLRPNMPPVFDQGRLGSCTANALGGAYQYLAIKEGLARDVPSRLFLYYNERAMEGTAGEDAGAFIRDGAKSLNHDGICGEFLWPYDPARFAERPTGNCYSAALQHTVTRYQRLPKRNTDLRYVLSQGLPFTFGFSVYESFESDHTNRTGIVSMPGPNEALLGGHAVLAVGYFYDGGRLNYIVRNSWGLGIGDEGYYYFPERYLTGPLSSDLWVLEVI